MSVRTLIALVKKNRPLENDQEAQARCELEHDSGYNQCRIHRRHLAHDAPQIRDSEQHGEHADGEHEYRQQPPAQSTTVKR